MRRTLLVTVFLVCAVIGLAPAGGAQDAARPTILNVTMDVGGNLLTVTGSGFGAAPVVTIDGQPVPVLPGATDAQLTVVTPTALLTTPGTYRLTVVDSVRQVGEVFVVASRAGLVPAVSLTTSGTSAAPAGAAADTGKPHAAGPAPATAGRNGGGPATTSAIENPGAPYLTALGSGAGALTTGHFDTAIGISALGLNTTGELNTAIGASALNNNTTGSQNTASGEAALFLNATGSSNTAVGHHALFLNTGDSNTATGDWTLASNSTGVGNTASGYQALYNNTTGFGNTVSGFQALYNNTSSSANTVSGYQALFTNANTTGANTAFGHQALYLNIGDHNTALGFDAGYGAVFGSYNLHIGAGVTGSSFDTNTIRLGLPFDGMSGQNQTYIAGIRGMAVNGGFPVVIDADGRLGTADGLGSFGIGTMTPTAKLDVEGAGIAPALLKLINTDPGAGTLVFDAIGGSIGGLVKGDALVTNGVGNLLFAPNAPGKSVGFVGGLFTNPIALTVADGGNVGIGTTTPGVKLDVRGTGGVAPLLSVTNTSVGGGAFTVDVASVPLAGIVPGDALLTNGVGNLLFAPNVPGKDVKFVGGLFNNPISMIIKDGGNVGIGTTAPTNPLQMGSGAYVSAGGVWTNASSRTLKEQIADLPASRALDAFAQLHPVTFVYKASPTETHVGFIAEDVPDLVATQDRRSLAAMDIVAVLTKVAQEQQKQIDAQSQQLTDLRERLRRLETLLEHRTADGSR